MWRYFEVMRSIEVHIKLNLVSNHAQESIEQQNLTPHSFVFSPHCAPHWQYTVHVRRLACAMITFLCLQKKITTITLLYHHHNHNTIKYRVRIYTCKLRTFFFIEFQAIPPISKWHACNLFYVAKLTPTYPTSTLNPYKQSDHHIATKWQCTMHIGASCMLT